MNLLLEPFRHWTMAGLAIIACAAALTAILIVWLRPLLVRYAMAMITGFSTIPLRIASAVGLIASLFGFGTLAYVLVLYVVRGVTVPGFTFLASLVSLLAGVQLLALGILGEYIAGMHGRSMKRPSYVVAETTSGPRSKMHEERAV